MSWFPLPVGIRRSLFAFPLSILLFAVAFVDSGFAQNKPVPMKPLAIGNSWRYIVHKPSPLADRFGKAWSERDTTTMVEEVVGTVRENGRTWYECRVTFRNLFDTIESVDRWANDRCGLVTPREDSADEMCIPFPADVDVFMEIRPGVTLTVVAVDSLITVPAGSFRCQVYRVDQAVVETVSYLAFAPGVGMVYARDGTSKGAVTELAEYTVR